MASTSCKVQASLLIERHKKSVALLANVLIPGRLALKYIFDGDHELVHTSYQELMNCHHKFLVVLIHNRYYRRSGNFHVKNNLCEKFSRC